MMPLFHVIVITICCIREVKNSACYLCGTMGVHLYAAPVDQDTIRCNWFTITPPI